MLNSVFFRQMTGASKCFGFVSYDNADSAKNAINTMNGFAVGGRQLQVFFFVLFKFSSLYYKNVELNVY